MRFSRVLFIPKTLTGVGVPSDCAAVIAEKAIEDSAAETNPRQATVAEGRATVAEVLSHGR